MKVINGSSNRSAIFIRRRPCDNPRVWACRSFAARAPSYRVPSGADHDDGLPIQSRKSADDRQVIGIHAVAVQLLKIAEHAGDVVERVWPLRVARQLRDLPRRQTGKDGLGERAALGVQPCDLLLDMTSESDVT